MNVARLGKVGGEILDHVAGDVSTDSSYLASGDSSLSKAYVDRKIAAHIHFTGHTVGGRDDSKQKGYCAILEAASWDVHLTPNTREAVAVDTYVSWEGFFRQVESGGVNDLVFISVPQTFQDRQLVPGRAVPSFVRLHCLNQCLVSVAYAIQLLPTIRVPVRPILASGSLRMGGLENIDRESIASGRPHSVEANKLPNKVIESRADVVNHLPKQDSQNNGGRLNIAEHLDVPIPKTVLWFRGDVVGIAFDVLGQLGLENIQLVLCPTELGPHTFQTGAAHGA